MTDILLNRKNILSLINFIEATEHFSHKFTQQADIQTQIESQDQTYLYNDITYNRGIQSCTYFATYLITYWYWGLHGSDASSNADDDNGQPRPKDPLEQVQCKLETPEQHFCPKLMEDLFNIPSLMIECHP